MHDKNINFMNVKQVAFKKGDEKSSASSRFNKAKWVLIFILLTAGVVANQYFAEIPWALRATAGVILIGILLAIVLQTTQGQQAWTFIKGSRSELRKVVWPTRQETIQTTLVVVAMVVITAIILWGVDTMFFWMISWLTGQ